MRWTPSGAHRLLQVRTRVLNQQLRGDFERWYLALRSAPERARRATQHLEWTTLLYGPRVVRRCEIVAQLLCGVVVSPIAAAAAEGRPSYSGANLCFPNVLP